MRKVVIMLFVMLNIACFCACSPSTDIEVTQKAETEAELQEETENSSADETTKSKQTALQPDNDIDSLFQTIERFEITDSSCFSEYGYSEEAEALLVTFKDSGVSYIYTEFPYSSFEEFENAASKGGYFNSSIKGKFTCYRED